MFTDTVITCSLWETALSVLPPAAKAIERRIHEFSIVTKINKERRISGIP